MRNLLIVVGPLAEESLLAGASKDRTGPAQDASRPSVRKESLRTERERAGSPRDDRPSERGERYREDPGHAPGTMIATRSQRS
jgi:hypothetical protein